MTEVKRKRLVTLMGLLGEASLSAVMRNAHEVYEELILAQRAGSTVLLRAPDGTITEKTIR